MAENQKISLVLPTRRQALVMSAATAVLPLFPSFARADGHCNAINQMIANAAAQKQNAGAWAITIAPNHIQQMRSAVAELEAKYANAASLANEVEFNAYLGVLNAFLAAGFAIAGATGAVAAAPLLIASIGVGGAMLIADGLTAPQSPDGLEIAADIGINRVGGLLSIAGEDAYAVSLNSAKYAAKAGKILGVVGAGMAAFSAGKKWGASSQRTAEEEKLRDALDTIRAELTNLEMIAYAEEVRFACMSAVEADLAGAYGGQTPACLD